MSSTTNDQLAALPDRFRYSEALTQLTDRQLAHLIAHGDVERVSHGWYRKTDALGDDDLLEVSARSPSATLCLRSALARHDLIDDILAEYDIAIPRGTWVPETNARVRWRHFDKDTFELGREPLPLEDGQTIGIYSAERSIIDAFRLRHLDGSDLANEALKRWLRRGGQPSTLLRLSSSLPRSMPALRRTLEILL